MMLNNELDRMEQGFRDSQLAHYKENKNNAAYQAWLSVNNFSDSFDSFCLFEVKPIAACEFESKQ